MKIILLVYTGLLAIFTIMPFVRSDYWIFRVCEYPRWQKLVFTLIALVATPFILDQEDKLFWWIMITMTLNAIYLFVLIYPFTSLSKKQVQDAARSSEGNEFRVMTSNVLQFNKDFKGCLAEIRKADPDVVVLIEANDKWVLAIEELEKEYSYTVKVPLDNTYGMLLYSRLELKGPQVHYLVEDGIPSIHTGIVLPGGKLIRLFAVHPSPPTPNINPRSTERDAELLKIAELAKQAKEPVIVVGDLNDVAWSYTTRLFLKISRLLDPRRGRGMYNTFNARNPIFRFPLDHAFISTDLRLVELRRLHNFHSDHFPMLLHVSYEPEAKAVQKPLKVTAGDRKLAKEKKSKA